MLATAIGSGYLGQHLEKLDLSRCNLGHMGLAMMMTKAMEVKGTFHALRQLDLSFCSLKTQDGEALGRALSAKIFPHLNKLRCGENRDMGERGWLAILKGLEEGGCTGLRYLNMSENNMSVAVATALTRALSSGLYHHLEELYLVDSCQDNESIRCILQSVKDVGFPSIRKFDLGCTRTNPEHSILLGEAPKAGALPKLEELRFAGAFPNLGELRVGEQPVHHSLWEALEAGSCPDMKELFFMSARFSTDSSTALASAMASGWLSKLQRFSFYGGVDGDNTSLAEVLSAMASSCSDLRELDLSGGFRNPATR